MVESLRHAPDVIYRRGSYPLTRGCFPGSDALLPDGDDLWPNYTNTYQTQPYIVI